MARKIKKAALISALVLFVLLVVFFGGVAIGKGIRGRTPKGGIHEDKFVEINGSEQWISVYGESAENPVLLYLHGGPGASTSEYDYAFTRQWADIYTVVTWDQRGCGKSYRADVTRITYDLLMQDGLALTDYLLEYLGKEKITLLGHSWGAYFGANLALEYPEKYEAFIGVGQLVNMRENERAFALAATEWVGDDQEGAKLLQRLTPDDLTEGHFQAKNQLMQKYGYGMYANERDYSAFFAKLFNPYYSLFDFGGKDNQAAYMGFVLSNEFLKFDLTEKRTYQVPYFTVNGDRDYQTNYRLAQAYYERISAPQKGAYLMKDTTHGLLETKSTEFSAILHKIFRAIQAS